MSSGIAAPTPPRKMVGVPKSFPVTRASPSTFDVLANVRASLSTETSPTSPIYRQELRALDKARADLAAARSVRTSLHTTAAEAYKRAADALSRSTSPASRAASPSPSLSLSAAARIPPPPPPPHSLAPPSPPRHMSDSHASFIGSVLQSPASHLIRSPDPRRDAPHQHQHHHTVSTLLPRTPATNFTMSTVPQPVTPRSPPGSPAVHNTAATAAAAATGAVSNLRSLWSPQPLRSPTPVDGEDPKDTLIRHLRSQLAAEQAKVQSVLDMSEQMLVEAITEQEELVLSQEEYINRLMADVDKGKQELAECRRDLRSAIRKLERKKRHEAQLAASLAVSPRRRALLRRSP